MKKQSQSKEQSSGQGEVFVHRKYKDRLFRMIFQDKENLLSLYNALNGTCYDNPEELSAAVERAVDECIKEGILSDFLRTNRSEAIKMSIFEYDEEKIIRAIREDEFEQGIEKGRILFAESILDLLNEYGVIPEELRQFILQESNLEILKK